MKKKYLIIYLTFTCLVFGQIDDPEGWTIDPSGFEFNANMVARLKLNETDIGEDVKLAAFSADEIRGVSDPTKIGEHDYFFLTIYSNDPGEKINFHAHLGIYNVVLKLPDSLNFEADALYGSIGEPRIINVEADTLFSPAFHNVPDMEIEEGAAFAPVDLSLVIEDPKYDVTELELFYTEPQHISFEIDNNLLATIAVKDSNWFGKDSTIITARNPDQFETTDTLYFIVKPVNDLPEFTRMIPAINIEGSDSTLIVINDYLQYITDVDNQPEELTIDFLYYGENLILTRTDDATYELRANSGWSGKDSVYIQVADTNDMVMQSIDVIAGSNNSLPTVSGIPELIVTNPDSIVLINIWDMVDDIETPDSLLTFEFIPDKDQLTCFYDPLSGSLIITCSAGYTGVAHIDIKITDATGGETVATMLLFIQDTTDNEEYESLPNSITLYQNYPNPFNPSTIIKYSIPAVADANFASAKNVSLRVFDIVGTEISVLQNGEQSPGTYERVWNASDVSSGVYFYILRVGRLTETKKMLLLK